MAKARRDTRGGAKKKAGKRGAGKKVDARKARVRDLASRARDVTGGASGFGGGGFSGFSARADKTS